MNWVPKEEPEPLVFGRLLHVIFERHARGNTMSQAIAGTRVEWYKKAINSTDEFERVVMMNSIEQLDDITEALIQWKDAYEFEIPVLEAEEPFELPLQGEMDMGSIVLVGRPDRVAVMAGKLWHVQNRGLAPGINFGVYTDLAKRHYHEHVYAEALNHKYCGKGNALITGSKYCQYNYGGTVFNLVRKLKYRTKITKKNPEGETKELSEMFYQYPMSIDLKSPLHEHIMDCVKEYAYRMRSAEFGWRDDGIIPPPNEAANGGFFHNKPDVYFRVLCGEVELGDPRFFKRRIDPYLVTNEN
jgi:hypothetical protein